MGGLRAFGPTLAAALLFAAPAVAASQGAVQDGNGATGTTSAANHTHARPGNGAASTQSGVGLDHNVGPFGYQDHQQRAQNNSAK